MRNIFVFIGALFLISCSTLKLVKSENTALVAVSASTSYLGGTGRGMLITLLNVETGERFESRQLSRFSAHTVVQSIKPGQYTVEKVVLDTGNGKFSNWSENVKEYFGVFEIEGGKKYYLGSYKGRVKLKFKNSISIQLTDYQIPEKLKTLLKDQNTGWENGDFELIYSVSDKELIIY